MRELTPKEQLVIQEFDKLRPGTGAIAQQNILNPNSGWSAIIDEMSESEIQVTSSIPKPQIFQIGD
jgi:hypothetical protein